MRSSLHHPRVSLESSNDVTLQINSRDFTVGDIPRFNHRMLYLIIESVDSINRDEPDSPLTQYITNAGISRARYTVTLSNSCSSSPFFSRPSAIVLYLLTLVYTCKSAPFSTTLLLGPSHVGVSGLVYVYVIDVACIDSAF